MAKRDQEVITLGSGKIYLMAFSASMPSIETICTEANLLGYIKGGASLEYTQETYEEKDDLGYVSKIITTDEEALLRCGLLTWNGNTLQKLIDRCGSTESNGKRITKIGGAGNAQGGYYAICFFHEDAADGNLWILIKGRNTAGATLTFAKDAGTVLEPEFKAMPHDTDGTLIELIEEIPLPNLTVSSSASSGTVGNTVITVSPAKGASNSYKYKTAASVQLPGYDEVLTSGWTSWDGSAEITATTGDQIVVAEVETSSNKAKKAGIAQVVSKA